MAKIVDTPAGPAEFPDDMDDRNIEVVLRRQFSTEQPKSRMRQFAEGGIPSPWDITRDYVTPQVSKTISPIIGNTLGDFISKMIVPQSATDIAMLAGGPALKGAAAMLPVVRNLPKVVKPIVSGALAGSTIGAAGEYTEGGSPATGAFLGGLGMGIGEGAGQVISKIRRSTSKGHRLASTDDMNNIVDEMKKTTTYTPPDGSPPVSPLDIPMVNENLQDPRRLMNFVKQGGTVDALRNFLGERLGELDQAVGRIDLPIIGRSLPPSRVWNIISDWGRKAYAGKQEEIISRTGETYDLRRAWEQGMDELAEGLFAKDRSGIAPGIADEARRIYKAGMEYSRRLGSDRNWVERGERPFLDTKSFQGGVNKDLGKLVKVDRFGEVSGGRMATPGKEMINIEFRPNEQKALTSGKMAPAEGTGTRRIFVEGSEAQEPASQWVQNPRRALPPSRGSQEVPPSIDPTAGRPPSYPETGPGPRRLEASPTRSLEGATPLQAETAGFERLMPPSPAGRGTVEVPSGPPTRFHMEQRSPDIVSWMERESGEDVIKRGARVPSTERGPELPKEVKLTAPREPKSVTREYETGTLAQRRQQRTGGLVPPEGDAPVTFDWKTYSRKPSNDFEGLEEALFRGAGAGTQDYDMGMTLRGLPKWIRDVAFGAASAVGMPYASRVYVGRTPRLIPPWVQNSINYQMMKTPVGLRPPAEE